MMKLSFPSLQGLAIAAFRDDGAREKYDEAIAIEHQKLHKMYDALVHNRVDYFVQKTTPSKIGRSLVFTWTRSSRPGVKIQMTTWLVKDEKKTFYALSHDNVEDEEDFSLKAMPDDGDVYGVQAESEEPEFITGFMQTLVDA